MTGATYMMAAGLMADKIYNGEDDNSLIDETLVTLLITGYLNEFGASATLSIETNLTQFAVFKNFWNKKEIRQILMKNKGMSFEDFKKEAYKINSQYNDVHLKTEFDTTKRSGEMYDEWEKFEQQKEKFPFLKYKTQEDDRVRHSHAALNNITRKVDDPFWLTFYPPCDFNCRCYVEQMEQAEETKINIINLKEIVNKAISKKIVNPFVSGNVAKSGKVFTKKHPYFMGVPTEIRAQLNLKVSKFLNQ